MTNRAVKDFSEIWSYPFEAWSEHQANKYYTLLIETCQKITNNPTLGKSYNRINTHLLVFGIGKHITFYQILQNKDILVIRFLHERMDLKNILKE
ncbi:type II toxin-antitoxin system RelE/ParE family toxin [Myroides odoratimimus]|uniref:type II toxin-antitoxin system RelE/ParE family toxin n=1 Tax=Myroides odoratimimus TaxID=76832 RepID=UPI00374D5A84